MSERCTRVQVKIDDPLFLPTKGHPDDAGYDLKARVDDYIILQPGERRLIPTGVRLGLPVGYEAQIRPRSGLALNHGLTIVNSPGTVDAGYRGELGIILHNTDQEYGYTVRRGDRIAQMVIHRLPTVGIDLVDELDETDRGEGGYGSTGVAAAA